MAGIRLTGMASGLPPNIVEQIMEAERIPVKNMEMQAAKEDNKLKIVSDLESKIKDISGGLTNLVGRNGFLLSKFLSGDPSVVDGSVDPENSMTGQWHIEVIQLAQKPGAISNGFPDKDQTEIGVGYLKFKTPEGTKEVYISGGGSTLEKVASAINSAGHGLRAMILNDRSDPDAPYRLMVTGLEAGEDNQVEFPTVYMLDGDEDIYFDQSRAAQNAKVKIDGFEIEAPDNIISDMIPGVTLDLKQAAPGREIRVSVRDDVEKIGEKVKTFVDSYNGVLQFIQDQHKLQKGPDGRERLGPLGGDSLARSIEARLRGLIMRPMDGVPSKVKRLGELGVEFNRNGTLNFNAEKFNAVLQRDPRDVAMFLRGDGFNVGFIPTVKREMDTFISGFGPVAVRKRGLQQKIDNINQRIETRERQLVAKEDSLRRKFADLETTMAKLQSQGGALGGFAKPPQG